MTLIISFIEDDPLLKLLTLEAVQKSDKSRVMALVLAVIPGGWHLMYVGKWDSGMIRFIQTFRIFGIVFNISDIFKILKGRFMDATNLPLR